MFRTPRRMARKTDSSRVGCQEMVGGTLIVLRPWIRFWEIGLCGS